MPKLAGIVDARYSTIYGVDPGGVHVGFAELYRAVPGWWMRQAAELPHDEAAEDIRDVLKARQLYDFDNHKGNTRFSPPTITLVVESFTLYPDKAKTQIGSDMPTSRLIGRLEEIAANLGIPLVMQPAAIKVPTTSLLESMHVPYRAPRLGAGGHAKDAETHAWHYLLRRDPNAPIDYTAQRRLGTKLKQPRSESDGD